MHPEMRQQSVYRLTFARADETLGPNLHRLDIDCDAIGASVLSGALTVDCIQSAPNGIRHCRTASTIEFLGTAKVTTLKSGGTQLFTLASALGSAIGRPVIDETGLPVARFPADCPYAADEVLVEGLLPDAELGT